MARAALLACWTGLLLVSANTPPPMTDSFHLLSTNRTGVLNPRDAYHQYLPSQRWQQLVGLKLQACPTAAAAAQLQQEMVAHWHKQAKSMPRNKAYKGVLDKSGLSCSAFGNCAVPVCNGAGSCKCPVGQTFNGLACMPSVADDVWFSANAQRWDVLPASKEEFSYDTLGANRSGNRDSPMCLDSELANDDKCVSTGYWANTTVLLDQFTDEQLVAYWRTSAPSDRFTTHLIGRYHGKKLLDVGSGLARTTMQFVEHGASVTFADIVMDNLKVLQRLCKALNAADRCKMLHITSVESFKALEAESFDAISMLGSIHHMPKEIATKEMHLALKALKPRGQLFMLVYPMTNWLRCKITIDSTSDTKAHCAFNVWGRITDGLEAPWAEWYELSKILDLVHPTQMEVEWCGHTRTAAGKSEFLMASLIKA